MRPSTLLACLALTAAAALSGCNKNAKSSASSAETADLGSVSMLRDWMVGSFDSSAQAQTDPSYFDIKLHMVEIWKNRNDGPWLYVEQAMAEAQDKPYRQRVYQLSPLGQGLYQSAVFEIADSIEAAQQYAGTWKDPNPLGTLGPNNLKRKDGCEVVLKYFPTENVFKGSTLAANCPSTLRGASFATSEITLVPGELRSWDRGYDAAGKQVWGAVKGGYIFIKTGK